MRAGFDWSYETVERLRTEWRDGVSATEIGRGIGCGKNAVIGKARRLGLPARANPVRGSKSDDAEPRMPNAIRLRPSKSSATVAPVQPVVVRRCQFPLWRHDERPKPPRFCNEAVRMPGSPYCDAHRRIAYVGVES